MTPEIKYPRLPEHLDRRIKVSDKQKSELIALRKLDKKKWSYRKLAEKFGITYCTASRICNPAQYEKAKAQTIKIFMEKYRNNPEFKRREANRVKELIKRRERTDPQFNKYQNQFRIYKKGRPNLKVMIDSLN